MFWNDFPQIWHDLTQWICYVSIDPPLRRDYNEVLLTPDEDLVYRINPYYLTSGDRVQIQFDGFSHGTFTVCMAYNAQFERNECQTNSEHNTIVFDVITCEEQYACETVYFKISVEQSLVKCIGTNDIQSRFWLDISIRNYFSFSFKITDDVTIFLHFLFSRSQLSTSRSDPFQYSPTRIRLYKCCVHLSTTYFHSIHNTFNQHDFPFYFLVCNLHRYHLNVANTKDKVVSNVFSHISTRWHHVSFYFSISYFPLLSLSLALTLCHVFIIAAHCCLCITNHIRLRKMLRTVAGNIVRIISRIYFSTPKFNKLFTKHFPFKFAIFSFEAPLVVAWQQSDNVRRKSQKQTRNRKSFTWKTLAI